jgi:hypothetical protein
MNSTPVSAAVIAGLGVFALILPQSSFGQCMACHVPRYPQGVAEKETATGWIFSVTQAYRYSDDTYAGTSDTGGGMETTSNQTIAGIEWQANSSFGIKLGVPYFWEFRRAEIGEETVDLDGFGDIRLTTSYRPLAKQESIWKSLELVAGLELPTGDDNNQVKNDALGFAVFEGLTTNSQFQLGSGTWDPIVGINLSVPISDTSFSVYTQNQAQFSIGNSSKGFEPGNAFSSEIGIQYRATEKFTIQLGAEGLLRDHDVVSGETLKNTGGTVLSATASANYELNDKVSFTSGVSLPFWRDLNAGTLSKQSSEEFGTSIASQSSPGPYFFGGIRIRF